MNFHELIQQEGLTIKKAKGEHVFRQGDVDQSLYFLQTGLIKAYYTSEEGKAFVKSFLLPNDLIGSLRSVHSGEQCSFSTVCLEATTLRKIPFDRLLEISQQDTEMANNVIELLIQLAIKKEKREFEFLCLDAETRFKRITESAPELLEKVTQNDLAAYLGITPVGLSRIKKRVLQK